MKAIIHKRFAIVILALFSVFSEMRANGAPPYKLLDSATAAYNKGNYMGSASFYDRFLKSGYVSADVYYNLGNCFYKFNNISKAILYYERAKKLNPADADIRFNLQLANLKITDKVPGETPLFIATWWNNLLDITGECGWSYLCIICLCLALMLILGYLFSRHLWLRQVGFWGAGLMIVLCMGCFGMARERYRALITHNTAIVMSPAVTVKGAPSDSGTALFIIHNGTKVTIVKSDGNWSEIKLSNGNVGWLLNTDIEAI